MRVLGLCAPVGSARSCVPRVGRLFACLAPLLGLCPNLAPAGYPVKGTTRSGRGLRLERAVPGLLEHVVNDRTGRVGPVDQLRGVHAGAASTKSLDSLVGDAVNAVIGEAGHVQALAVLDVSFVAMAADGLDLNAEVAHDVVLSVWGGGNATGDYRTPFQKLSRQGPPAYPSELLGEHAARLRRPHALLPGRDELQVGEREGGVGEGVDLVVVLPGRE